MKIIIVKINLSKNDIKYKNKKNISYKMRKLLLLLLIVFVATQKKPRPKFKIIRTLNVTKK